MNMAKFDLRIPEEIWLKIFDCMDFETLKSSTQVCREWNQMIGKKFKLVINNENEEKLRDTLTRKYSAIMLRNLKSVHHKLMEDILNIADLRILEVVCCRMKEEDDRKLNKIFASSPNLETLKIIISDFDLDFSHLTHLKSLFLEMPFSNTINFGETTQLKSLTLNQVKLDDIRFLDFIANQTSLEQLELRNCGTYRYNRNHVLDLTNLTYLKFFCLEGNFSLTLRLGETTQLKSLTLNEVELDDILLFDFIASQTSLEQLVIQKCYGHNSINSIWKLNAIQFPLKKLTLKNYDNLFQDEEFLLIFMSKISNTLEELEFDTTFPASFYEMIFTKFHKLNTLKIVSCLPYFPIAFNHICPNLFVKKLIVVSYKENLEPIKDLIEKLPNIETLVLDDSYLSNELMMSISLNLTKLKNLALNRIFDEAFENVKIPSLKTISIMSLKRNKPRYWTTITLALPNIEVFEVINPGITMNDRNINIITKHWTLLQHISFGKGFLATKAACNQLLSNCRNLKTLEISEIAFKNLEKVEIVRNFERNGVSLNIRPEKFKEWSIDSYLM